MRPIILLAFAALSSAGTALPAAAQVAPTDCATVDGEPRGEDQFTRDVWIANRASCALPPPDLSVAEALTMLAAEDIAVRREGDVVTVIARSEDVVPRLCCSLQGTMHPIGDGLYAARQRMARAAEAPLELMLWEEEMRGVVAEPRMFPAPEQAPPPDRVAEIAGRIVDASVKSEALGENRRYSVYLPPSYRLGTPLPLLVMADGAALESMAPLIEAAIASGRIPPLVALGVHSGPRAISDDATFDYDVRGADYVPDGFPEHADRFEGHLRFVTDELMPRVVAEYGLSDDRQDTIVAGWSNGGVFAINVGLREPEAFGAAIVMSAGARYPDYAALTREVPRARFYGSVGLHEPYFRVATRRAMRVLREEGYTATYAERPAGHDFAQWEAALIDGLERALAERGAGGSPGGG